MRPQKSRVASLYLGDHSQVLHLADFDFKVVAKVTPRSGSPRPPAMVGPVGFCQQLIRSKSSDAVRSLVQGPSNALGRMANIGYGSVRTASSARKADRVAELERAYWGDDYILKEAISDFWGK